MPVEIELSTMLPAENFIRPLLDRFEAETGIHVRLHLMDWETAWMEQVRSALYGDGPDVSEVGSTWTGDLLTMDALRPFSAAEVMEIGPREMLLPGAAATARVEADRAWTIPWVTGSRMLFYRPDLLEKVGPVSGAFADLPAFAGTLEKLHSAGVRWPWVVWPVSPRQIIQHAAAWVWAAGGDYLNPDGRSVAFAEPQALQGFSEFFALLRSDGDTERSGVTPDAFFLTQPEAAIRISGTWLYRALLAPRPYPGEIATAPLPGPAFFGGQNLMVWKYTQHPQEAVQLVQFLLRPDVQVEHCQAIGLLPARLDALDMPPYLDHPFWRVAAQSLRSGRTFPAVKMWGLVEDRLSSALYAVAADMRVNPNANIKDLLHHHLTPLKRRLDLLLREQG